MRAVFKFCSVALEAFLKGRETNTNGQKNNMTNQIVSSL